MAKGDVLVRMKADVSNYDANIAKARGTLERFKQENLTMGGVLNQSTRSIVAAAAQYASFAAVLGTVASGFANAVSKGMEMSREAEGVKAAFDRLNQPGLLDNLREATHNTVNDLDLMKQAVKFDNFNLSLQQMGTFLAFAQQQAKDTGQDVNYLVDSIVTGLGRKSLPILDNLGLSATEIRERMKETGDMTEAVAQIIHERMSNAGDYVETAADRAAQGQVKLDNAMKELGDTMNSLSGSGATLWNELEVGAINLANSAIKPLISLFNELAGYIQGTSVEKIITNGLDDVTDTVDDNGRLIRKNAIASIPEIVVSGNKPTIPKRINKGGSTTQVELSEMQTLQKQIQELEQEYIKLGDITTEDADKRRGEIQSEIHANETRINQIKLLGEQAHGKLLGGVGVSSEGLGANSLAFDGNALQKNLDYVLEQIKVKPIVVPIEAATDNVKKLQDTARTTAKVVGTIGQAFNAIEDPAGKVAAVVAQAIANVALAYSDALAKTTAEKFNIWSFIAASASAMISMGTTIASIHSATGYAQGGIVKGNSYSGDNVGGLVDGSQLVGLNAGELVLNKAQQNTLAQNLQNNGQTIRVVGKLHGKDLFICAENWSKSAGHGEFVTW